MKGGEGKEKKKLGALMGNRPRPVLYRGEALMDAGRPLEGPSRPQGAGRDLQHRGR